MLDMVQPIAERRRSDAQCQPARLRGPVRCLYDAMWSRTAQKESAYDFLTEQLRQAAELKSELPEDSRDLMEWMHARHEETGRAYQAYVAERRGGAPRRLLSSRAHALHFLRGVAPTKLVDGAWLYGVLQRWSEARFRPLVTTYLEELGDGVPSRNHVALYRQLLAQHGCEPRDELPDAHYVQGAIQLALAQHADRFLPEVIGFNLGYEQLPLHLPITAYELNELGIDPYYFTLHLTIDNAGSGHARKAIEAVFNAMPALGDARAFYRRVVNGYMLNELGASTPSVIASFDLHDELIEVLRRKSVVGRNAHSDYCRLGGKTVGEWLSDPGLMPQFVEELERRGWIRRNEPPENSRFWRLLKGDKAEMFGVFDAYELQVIGDWIAGSSSRPLPHRARRRLLADIDAEGQGGAAETMETSDDDFDAGTRMVQSMLSALPNRRERLDALVPMMAPGVHDTPEGLMATRLFARDYLRISG